MGDATAPGHSEYYTAFRNTSAQFLRTVEAVENIRSQCKLYATLSRESYRWQKQRSRLARAG